MNNIIQYTYHVIACMSLRSCCRYIFHSLMPSLLSKNGCPPFLIWFGKLHPHTYIHTGCMCHFQSPDCPIRSSESMVQWNLSIEDTVGPSWLSCIQWKLSLEDTIGTQLAVLYTVEPLYRGHHRDPVGCPLYSGTTL